MKENKNIDRLFQEKFRDFEQTPPSHIWGAIESKIYGKTRKKYAAWFWLSGIAAGIALLFTLNNLGAQKEIVIPETSTIDNKLTPNSTVEQNEVVQTKTVDLNSKASITESNNTEIILSKTKQFKQTPIQKSTLINTAIAANNTPAELSNNSSVLEGSLSNKTSAPKHLEETASSIENAQNEMGEANKFLANSSKKIEETNLQVSEMEHEQKNPIKEKEPKLALTEKSSLKKDKVSKDKWSVSTLAAPMYLSSFNSDISSIDQSFDKNVKQGVFSKAYGVQVAYALSDKLHIQTGVQLVDYGYRTYDVYVSPSGNIRRFSSINYSDRANIEVTAEPGDTPSDVYQIFSLGEIGNLTQVFGYVEIPFEAKYQVVSGAFGINAVGGLSTLILNKNQIYIETDNFSSELGNGVTNLNKLNFTANFGVELDYKLYKNIHFNLTPMLKVHTNTFAKDTRGFSPYALGVYSGLNYRF